MAGGRNTSSGDSVSQNAPAQTRHRGGRAVFRYPSFVRYLGARLLTVLALQMQSVAVGWQIYEITRSPLALGLTGLAQFLPGILLFLISGQDRKSTRLNSSHVEISYAVFCL